MTELIIDIILGSFVFVSHISVLVIALLWRKKKFHKVLHMTTGPMVIYTISFVFCSFLSIGGFTFLDNGTVGTKTLIASVLISIPSLLISLFGACFCIYIDGTHVVKRTLFKEIRIDLSKNDVCLIHFEEPLIFIARITDSSGNEIRFRWRNIQGDFRAFWNNCKSIVRTRESVPKK